MEQVERWMEIGGKLGFVGAELAAYVQKYQDREAEAEKLAREAGAEAEKLAREERAIARETLKEKKEPHRKGLNTYWYEEIDGVLDRRFQNEKSGHRGIVTQVVVPEGMISRVMKLAHEAVLVGHMGTKKKGRFKH